jgi:hypothetical protein
LFVVVVLLVCSCWWSSSLSISLHTHTHIRTLQTMHQVMTFKGLLSDQRQANGIIRRELSFFLEYDYNEVTYLYPRNSCQSQREEGSSSKAKPNSSSSIRFRIDYPRCFLTPT